MVVICVIAVRRKAAVVICVTAVRRKAVVVICVIAVLRLRHCNTSEPIASVSLVSVTSMDVVRMYVFHVPKNGGETVPFKRRRQKKRNRER